MKKHKTDTWGTALLLEFCYNVFNNESFFPQKNKTFCNQAVATVSRMFGFAGLTASPANNQIKILETSHLWIKTTPEQAQAEANIGKLVLAAKSGNPHGHIVVLLPGITSYSDKWKEQAPRCMDIGRAHTFGLRTNWAFKEKPVYWVYLDQNQ